MSDDLSDDYQPPRQKPIGIVCQAPIGKLCTWSKCDCGIGDPPAPIFGERADA